MRSDPTSPPAGHLWVDGLGGGGGQRCQGEAGDQMVSRGFGSKLTFHCFLVELAVRLGAPCSFGSSTGGGYHLCVYIHDNDDDDDWRRQCWWWWWWWHTCQSVVGLRHPSNWRKSSTLARDIGCLVLGIVEVVVRWGWGWWGGYNRSWSWMKVQLLLDICIRYCQIFLLKLIIEMICCRIWFELWADLIWAVTDHLCGPRSRPR